MTVSSTGSKVAFIGNGTTTSFTFNFAIPAINFIQVTTTDLSGVSTVVPANGYIVTLNPLIGSDPTPTGGQVLYPATGSPLPTGWTITIARILPVVQDTSIANQGIMYPAVVEEALDYLTMLDQDSASASDRAFQVGLTDPIPALVPPVAARANLAAIFDSLGNLTGGAPPAGGVFISAAMIPVVGAATLAIARNLLGVTAPTLVVSSGYTITQANNRQVLNLTGAAFYTVQIGNPNTGFDNTFWIVLFNNDTRGKTISVFSQTPFILWPSQWMMIAQDGTTVSWVVTDPGRWQSTTTVNFHVDPVNGNDNNDGLAVGTAAFLTIQRAVNVVQQIADGPFVINLANGTYAVGGGVICNTRVLGANGYTIQGNVSTPNSVIIQSSGSAGSCGIIVQDNAVVNLSGFQMSSVVPNVSGGNSACIKATKGGVANINGVNFGQFGMGLHIWAQGGAKINITGPYHIFGDANVHLAATIGAEVLFLAGTITIDSTSNFGFAFIWGTANSTISVPETTSTPNNFVGGGFVGGGGNGVSLSYNSILNIQSAGSIPNPGGGPNVGTGSFFVS
jgi:hypothetical protein